MTNNKIYGEVQAQADSLKSLNGGSVTVKQRSYEDFIKVVQSAPLEMEYGGQATIDEF